MTLIEASARYTPIRVTTVMSRQAIRGSLEKLTHAPHSLFTVSSNFLSHLCYTELLLLLVFSSVFTFVDRFVA